MPRYPAVTSARARPGLRSWSGGDKPAFDRALPLFQKMGETIALMGGPGAGQHTKMANQIAIAGTMIGTIESLLYAKTAGLGMDAVIDIIGKGAAASWSLNNLGRRIAKGDFAPGFYIKHFVKDMGIALQEARRDEAGPARSCAGEPVLRCGAGAGARRTSGRRDCSRFLRP